VPQVRILGLNNKWELTGWHLVIIAGYTVFTLGDMIMYNRRKKKEWYSEQKNIVKRSLVEALRAEEEGTATADQLLLLKEERDNAAREASRVNKPSIWKTVKGAFSTEGYKREDKAYGDRRQEILDRINAAQEAGTSAGGSSKILQAVDEKRREGEKQLEKQHVEPGPLDKLAAEAANAATSSSKSWTSWFSR
jgi:hypothetical protein